MPRPHPFTATLLLSLLAAGCSSPPPVAETQEPAPILSARVQPGSSPDTPLDAIESSWIRPEVGATEARIGARVERVEPSANGEEVAVSIALPPEHKGIEEVTVYGRAAEPGKRRPRIFQPSKVEVLSSPEKNGIVIYLPKAQDFVLRINYYESQPDVIPDRIRE